MNPDSTRWIILLDFAESYQFIVRYEIQGFHWNKLSSTIHSVVVYYKDDNSSDDMEHDTCFVHQVQKKVLSCIKRKFPNLQQVEYFSECCTGQHKNFKNFLNSCHHKCDFGFEPTCSFFATSHDKSSNDGIGGTVKRITAESSLNIHKTKSKSCQQKGCLILAIVGSMEFRSF